MKATRTIEVTLVLDEEEAEWLLATLDNGEGRPPRSEHTPEARAAIQKRFTSELRGALDYEY